MKQTGIFLVLFGVLNIIFPDLLAYLLGGLFIIIGTSLLLANQKIGKQQKNEEQFVKFGNFKIYR